MIEKPTMKTAIEKRAAFCQRMIRSGRRWAGPDPLFYAVEALEVRHRELEIGLALVFVAVEGERQVDPGAVLFEERGPLRGAPRNGPEPPPLLVERHLEMALLDRPGAVDDLDRAGMEDGTWVGQPERTHRVQALDEIVGNRLQMKRSVDAQPRPELIRFEHVVGV